ncbi:Spx/MgsR family RNA polymerase-binding regulatory protein [Haloferula chungangensis]|uniref:Spx/MgsR family RNA polymerase-binding regulatory protein n=1 Tax=Haloferula chungangensis TaxID=1048331 RepID=A0ABW2KZS9_9BACT
MKIYAYKGCDSCRKAIKWLKSRELAFEEIAVRETPPSVAELKKVLASYGGDLKRLFNTAGGDYREMGMKDRLPEMSETDALELLSKHGNLVKRPILLGKDVALVGFKQDEWEQAFG